MRPNSAYLVGEKGPEIFTPRGFGNIHSNMESAQGMFGGGGGGSAAPVIVPAPNVSLNVVNVSDPKEVHDAMGSEEGQRTIVNVIRQRRREVGNALG